MLISPLTLGRVLGSALVLPVDAITVFTRKPSLLMRHVVSEEAEFEAARGCWDAASVFAPPSATAQAVGPVKKQT